ncbi:hypothetical protein [Myxococcus virescens]|nr:hypothetical protein [Myxococcus virescens]SDE53482.1 hypothetical protein SAMN04488504_10896 [Myxococcus virescens]
MTDEKTEKMVEDALERWRNPPPLTEDKKRQARAAEELLELIGDDED